jgi:hypothetical protein
MAAPAPLETLEAITSVFVGVMVFCRTPSSTAPCFSFSM